MSVGLRCLALRTSVVTPRISFWSVSALCRPFEHLAVCRSSSNATKSQFLQEFLSDTQQSDTGPSNQFGTPSNEKERLSSGQPGDLRRLLGKKTGCCSSKPVQSDSNNVSVTVEESTDPQLRNANPLGSKVGEGKPNLNNVMLMNKRDFSTASFLSSSSVAVDALAKDISKTSDKVVPQNRLPTEQQLEHLVKVLKDNLPKIFRTSQDLGVYSKDIVFDNRIRGTKTVGLLEYYKQITSLKLVGALKFASVGFQIHKVTTHPEDGTIRMRFVIKGVPGMKVIFMFWIVKVWKWKKMLTETDTWYDGLSTYHVGSDGLIFKHVAENMMGVVEDGADKSKDKPSAREKNLVS